MKLETKEIDNIISSVLKGNKRDFCKRVWGTDQEIYRRRIQAIGFQGLDLVLDAGCGFGQWLPSMSELNREVIAVDTDTSRVTVANRFCQRLEIINASVKIGTIDELDFPDNYFNGIFSYSVIYLSDFRLALKEYHRVLKSGGKLYFNTNGVGWYLHNLLNTVEESEDFSSKKMAKTAIINSIFYYSKGKQFDDEYASIITPQELVIEELEKLGFTSISYGPEGTLNPGKIDGLNSFFKGTYEGYEGVTEYLCVK